MDESTQYLAELRHVMHNNRKAGKLSIWTVYDHPKDYPRDFVARLHEADARRSRPTRHVLVANRIDTLRYVLCFDLGLTRLSRNTDDDAKIVETWL